MAWDKHGGSRFTHYTTHVAPNYKTIFFAERGKRTHRYMLEPISLYAIRTIASMWLSSHALRCETGRWGKVMRMVDYAHFALNKFKSLSIILWYNALPLIIFNHAFHTYSTKPNPCTNLQLQCAFSIVTFIGKVLEHQVLLSRLQHSLVKFLNIKSCLLYCNIHVKCNIFCLIGHIWSPKTIIESIYLSVSQSINQIYTPIFGLFNWEEVHPPSFSMFNGLGEMCRLMFYNWTIWFSM